MNANFGERKNPINSIKIIRFYRNFMIRKINAQIVSHIKIDDEHWIIRKLFNSRINESNTTKINMKTILMKSNDYLVIDLATYVVLPLKTNACDESLCFFTTALEQCTFLNFVRIDFHYRSLVHWNSLKFFISDSSKYETKCVFFSLSFLPI